MNDALIIALGVFGIYLLARWRWRSPPDPRRRAGKVERAPPQIHAPAEPAERAEQGDQDNWEGAFWDAAEPVRITAHLRIHYVDGQGRSTGRDVTVRQFDAANPNGLLLAHCHLRNATRSFLISRISDAIDLDSGEVVSALHPWLLERYKTSPQSAAAGLAAQHDDVLAMLLYIGKADGRFTKKEKAVIAQWAARVSGDPRFDEALVTSMLQDFGEPTLTGFRAATRRVGRQDASFRAAVLDTCRSIVGTQLTVSLEEQGAIDYATQHLGTSLPPPQ